MRSRKKGGATRRVLIPAETGGLFVAADRVDLLLKGGVAEHNPRDQAIPTRTKMVCTLTALAKASQRPPVGDPIASRSS